MDSPFFKRKRAALFEPAGNCGRRGQKRLRWIVQGDVGSALLANVLNECRLADLPRPGDQQDRKQLAGSFKMVFQSSMLIINHFLKTVQILLDYCGLPLH
jgi:hypothetical protein